MCIVALQCLLASSAASTLNLEIDAVIVAECFLPGPKITCQCEEVFLPHGVLAVGVAGNRLKERFARIANFNNLGNDNPMCDALLPGFNLRIYPGTDQRPDADGSPPKSCGMSGSRSRCTAQPVLALILRVCSQIRPG